MQAMTEYNITVQAKNKYLTYSDPVSAQFVTAGIPTLIIIQSFFRRKRTLPFCLVC